MGFVFSNVLYPHACLKGVVPPVRKSFRAWWKGAKPILTLKILKFVDSSHLNKVLYKLYCEMHYLRKPSQRESFWGEV